MPNPKPNMSSPKTIITPFQSRVYHLLLQIPAGEITTYAHLARALSTSPRAVGNALRHNPYAPAVPCHRVIQTSGNIGGFMGELNRAPSGVNQMRKRALLESEGVRFDEEGLLLSVAHGRSVDFSRRGGKGKGSTGGGGGGAFFDGPWDTTGEFERSRFEKEEE